MMMLIVTCMDDHIIYLSIIYLYEFGHNIYLSNHYLSIHSLCDHTIPRMRLAQVKVIEGGVSKRSPYGAWVLYTEKKTGRPFYYNPVTRMSTKERPKDYVPDKTRLVKEVIYGLSFYH